MIGTYTGEPLTEMIADQTNPWVESHGQPINWTRHPVSDWRARYGVTEVTDCEGCEHSILPGVIESMDTPEGIQRCDSCQRHRGDLDAALALAALVGGVVRFEIEDDE